MGPGEELAAQGVYAEASALVKLVFPETESRALDAALRSEDAVIASEVVAVELYCAVHRRGLRPTAVEPVLDRLALKPLNEAILARARRPFPRPLRALDAIHLATVLAVRTVVGTLYTYDAELAEAAVGEGIRVSSPA